MFFQTCDCLEIVNFAEIFARKRHAKRMIREYKNILLYKNKEANQ